MKNFNYKHWYRNGHRWYGNEKYLWHQMHTPSHTYEIHLIKYADRFVVPYLVMAILGLPGKLLWSSYLYSSGVFQWNWQSCTLDNISIESRHCFHNASGFHHPDNDSQIAKFMGPTWGPPGSYRPHMGPMLAPWTLLSGLCLFAPHSQNT